MLASTGTVTGAKTRAVVEKPSRVVSPSAAGPKAVLKAIVFSPDEATGPVRRRSRGSGAMPEPESTGAVGMEGAISNAPIATTCSGGMMLDTAVNAGVTVPEGAAVQ